MQLCSSAPVDILVNSAGVCANSLFEDTEPKKLEACDSYIVLPISSLWCNAVSLAVTLQHVVCVYITL